MISAAGCTPPRRVVFTRSALPASTLLSTSFRSRIADGWMPSSVATRTITSLRWRSLNCFSTSAACSNSRCTRIAATICGCSWRISSATAGASIHFRLSMPLMSSPRRMRSISSAALSSPSARFSTERR